MTKIASQRKLKWCLQHYDTQEITSKWAAQHLKISQRRFQQVYKQYKQTGKILHIKQRAGGRPKKEIPKEWKNLIKQQYEQTRCNALYLEKKINHKHHIHISHRIIHEVLLELGYAEHEAVKQKRRKPWIRYERTHSLSLVHMDYHYCKDGRYLCTVLDDASRKVLAAGEFDYKTTQNALIVLKQAQKSCDFYPILAVLTDHGSEFYANLRDAKGYAEHGFELYLKEQGIKHVLCGVNHPQTNGKVEKWHDLYIHHRMRFSSLDDMLLWYNEEKPHGALNLEIAETPSQAFIRKMRPEVWLGLATKTFNW
jgi:transposase InsO family protein